jgi:Xaa-Pro aminopeptidase
MSSDLDLVRRERVLEAMSERGLDVLVLGRQDDADYASGMQRLWVAGTRPFGAGCVVVAATARVHLLSSWDAGIPPSVAWEDLFPATWNPRIMGESLSSIEGLREARRLGVDASSPAFAKAAARFAPDAEVVPADDLMAEVRRTKLPDEVERIRAACTVARKGVEAVLAALGEGIDDTTALEGIAWEALAFDGWTIPSSVPSVRLDRAAGSGAVAAAVDVGVLAHRYEGGVGGRFVDGSREPSPELVAACVPGATHADLAAAGGTEWMVRGVGMGWEPPVLTPDLGLEERLEEGMVLSVGDGPHRDVVAVGAGGPEVLSSAP